MLNLTEKAKSEKILIFSEVVIRKSLGKLENINLAKVFPYI